MRQHKLVIELRRRLIAAGTSGNERELRNIRAELLRIELRELTPEQRDEQGWHIAQQSVPVQRR